VGSSQRSLKLCNLGLELKDSCVSFLQAKDSAIV
jgi:hypothetical protein